MAKQPEQNDVDIETVGETENYQAWVSYEPDGERVIHLELGPVTLHFFDEEWQEVAQLVESVRKALGTK